MDWKDIRTAPRDGTRLLLWDAQREVAVSGHWHDDPGMDNPNGYEPAWAWWVSDDEVIMWDGGPEEHPTHWALFEPPGTDPTPAAAEARATKATETQATVSAWCEATFGNASSNARVAARANEEMAEMLKDLTRRDDDTHAIEEAADVLIILFRLAARMGRDLLGEVDRKMAVNRARKWNVGPDGHGYHVKETSLPPPEAKDGAALSPETGWRCFHCDEVFTTVEAAREHFGADETYTPACQIDAAEYRRMEEVHRQHLNETDEASRTFYGMQADHRQALIREEEKGYARGLADARKDAAPAAPSPDLAALIAALEPFAVKLDELNDGEYPFDPNASDDAYWEMNIRVGDLRRARTAILHLKAQPNAGPSADGGKGGQ